MIARAVYFAGRAAIDAANEAHFGGVWMSWWYERTTVNAPKGD